MIRAYLTAGAVAALAAGALWLDHRAYWRGWNDHAAEVAEATQNKDRELTQLSRENAALMREIEGLRAEYDQIDREVRDAIPDHPQADDPGFPPGIMRQLNRTR